MIPDWYQTISKVPSSLGWIQIDTHRASTPPPPANPTIHIELKPPFLTDAFAELNNAYTEILAIQ